MNFKIDKNKVLEKIKNITESNLKIKFLIFDFEKVSLVKAINLSLLYFL